LIQSDAFVCLCLTVSKEAMDIEEDMVTEPPQHPDVRRKIRIQYRTLLNDVTSE